MIVADFRFFYIILQKWHLKGAIYLTVNRSQTAFAIIRHLKPRKFKDVHLNKSPMSAPNNIIESHDSLFLK